MVGEVRTPRYKCRYIDRVTLLPPVRNLHTIKIFSLTYDYPAGTSTGREAKQKTNRVITK